MEHAKVFARRGKAGDGVALPRRVGIARCRDHHPEGGAAVPVRLESIELSLDRPLDQIEQVAPQAQQDRLRFRIAAPAVEFQRARIARAVDHQTGVEEADVAVAFLGHSREHRLDPFAHDAGVQLGGHDGGGRIRAHAAGVGALIAVPEALVVLARGKRQHVFPVGKNNEARLLAFEEFLDHRPAALTTIGAPRSSTYACAGRASSKVANAAVGMRWRVMNSLANCFELSSCAQARVGPKIRSPLDWNTSTMPSASGASGPTTVRWIPSASANSASLPISEIAMFSRPFSRAVPPFPGATNTFCTRGFCARRHAIACSLPPEPMTSSFISAGNAERR